MTCRLCFQTVLLLTSVVVSGCSGPIESGSGTAGLNDASSESLGAPVDSSDDLADSTSETGTNSHVVASSGEGPSTIESDPEPAASDEPTSKETEPSPRVGESTAADVVAVHTAGDWTMWGGDNFRNMVNTTTGIHLDIVPPLSGGAGRGVKWTVQLGSQTYGNPVVADGRVFVGTNNGAQYREHYPREQDKGIILCFSEDEGTFLWQLTRDKLPAGRVNDWNEQGICSTPCVEHGRMYVVTNRCELMCIDIEGFHDGENDGPYQDEVDSEENDADIIWILDMIDELGVFPHNLATSSPLIHEDLVLVLTSNGVDEAHLELPSPRAPSFIGVNKDSGTVVWEADFPSMDSRAPERFGNVLHGQWGSPALAVINGQAQVFMPGGDGVLYSLDAASGELVWWFDLNPKDSVWELGGRGTRNAIISTPVVVGNDVILAVGQDPEHGEGVGHLYRIDATNSGDISPQIADGNGWADNPESGQIWHYGGIDGTDDLIFRRTMSTVAITDGRIYAADLAGFLHCLDYETGQRKWVHDTFAAVWGSPMVVDGRVLLGDEDGDLVILRAGDEEDVLDTLVFDSSIYSTPTVANGTLFVSDRSRLYAFKIQ